MAEIDLSPYDLVIEPSAGNGAFSIPLSALVGDRLRAYDLAPEAPGIQQQDWFEMGRQHGKILVVGNPPFGVKYHLAKRFINHAFEVVGAQTVAFVLPRSFRKPSVQRLLFDHAHLGREIPLPDPAFSLRGEPYKVPVVFQVWEWQEAPRPTNSPVTTPYVEFVKPHDEWDLAVFRVGGHAGKAVLPGEKHVGVYNYFLRNLTDVPHPEVAEAISQTHFPGMDDCVGPQSLPKSQLIPAINGVFERLRPEMRASE